MEKDKREMTLSQEFERIQKDFYKITDSDVSSASTEIQELITKTIKGLEDLTNNVSAVDMFSKNENFEEMDPHQLKFLLLPYMLGVLWQLNTKENRKDICDMSQIYFKDYLKRCTDYEFIKSKDEETTEGDEVKPPRKLTQEEKRDCKVRKFKENKELEAKIEAYRKWSSKFAEDDADSGPVSDIYTSLIKRAINEAEDQLESIEMELNLITFGKSSSNIPQSEAAAPVRSQPLKPFIITKDKKQKEVFGMGYPSLPVMTVEELYEQRRADGSWGPPPTDGHMQNPEVDADEAEAKMKELLEEQDDEGEVQRQRQNDEYKDDHRRGWGNRFNRS